MYYVFLIIGLLWSGFVLYAIIMGMKSQQWPVTQGKILTTEVRKHIPDKRSGGVRRPTYKPYVRYEFTVGDQRYENDLIAFAQKNYFSDSDAQKALQKYPINTDVKVYYNPKSHKQAVLVVGVKPSVYIGFLFGLLITIIGLIGILNA